jgi:L-amino acid N-acyltransferase YncA
VFDTTDVNPTASHVINLRDAADTDLSAVQRIYAHYVVGGFATFEEVPPTIDDLRQRRAAILERGLPYLVAAMDGRVVGYAYAGVYRPRPAYRFTAEDSVYVAEDVRGRGIGRQLLAALITRCEQSSCRQLIAIIGDSANVASVGLHAALGFRVVGTLHAVGYKFGRWVDTVVMQREIRLGETVPPADDSRDRQPR